MQNLLINFTSNCQIISFYNYRKKYPQKHPFIPTFYNYPKHTKQMYICAFSQVKNLNVCCAYPHAGYLAQPLMFRTNFGRVPHTPSPLL